MPALVSLAVSFFSLSYARAGLPRARALSLSQYFSWYFNNILGILSIEYTQTRVCFLLSFFLSFRSWWCSPNILGILPYIFAFFPPSDTGVVPTFGDTPDAWRGIACAADMVCVCVCVRVCVCVCVCVCGV
jgi:hypothetical protein